MNDWLNDRGHPLFLSNDEIRTFLLHLIEEEHWEASSVNQMFNALRFLYVELYKMPFVLGNIPRPKKENKLPDVLSRDEVKRLLKVVPNPNIEWF